MKVRVYRGITLKFGDSRLVWKVSFGGYRPVEFYDWYNAMNFALRLI